MKKYLIIISLYLINTEARVIHRSSDASIQWAIQRAQIDQIRRMRARENRKYQKQLKSQRKIPKKREKIQRKT